MAASDDCSVLDCANLVLAKGMCRKHYKRMAKWGTTDLPVRAYERQCGHLGCDHTVGMGGARGFCPTHYDRLRRTGSTTLAVTKRPAGCAFETCDRRPEKRGLCAAHYRQARSGGELRTLRWDSTKPKECVVCGARDWPQNGFRSVCGPNCRARLVGNGGAPPDRQRPCTGCGMVIDLTAKTRAGHVKRRDTKLCDLCYGAHYTRHKTSPAVLAQRDGTGCKICGDPVDMSLRAPDLFRASVDHKVPFAKGGTHDPVNLQLAHLWCNQAKGDRADFSLVLPSVGREGGQTQ